MCPYLPLEENLFVQSPEPEAIAAAADFAVLSLPNGLASGLVPRLIDLGVRVVDLSADYRFPSLNQWANTYSSEAKEITRTDHDLCAEAVYGLVEWATEQLPQARLVATPGCFPTASLLALMPLLQQGLIEGEGIVIDAKTGTSGGGRAAKEHLLLAEASEAVAPYGVLGHRHTAEIELLASRAAGRNIQLQFTPHLIPMVRGLLATVYGRLRDPGLTAEDLTTLYQVTYKNHPCVDILPVGTYPSTKWVKNTNKALISVAVDKRTSQVIVMSVIDNMIKGQAGQAIQSLNVMTEQEAETGLPMLPFYP
jgi:N-acetyl-gamma-glutamyl-phosphate reductase